MLDSLQHHDHGLLETPLSLYNQVFQKMAVNALDQIFFSFFFPNYAPHKGECINLDEAIFCFFPHHVTNHLSESIWLMVLICVT